MSLIAYLALLMIFAVFSAPFLSYYEQVLSHLIWHSEDRLLAAIDAVRSGNKASAVYEAAVTLIYRERETKL